MLFQPLFQPLNLFLQILVKNYQKNETDEYLETFFSSNNPTLFDGNDFGVSSCCG